MNRLTGLLNALVAINSIHGCVDSRISVVGCSESMPLFRQEMIASVSSERQGQTTFVNLTTPTSINEACLAGYDLGPDDLGTSR